MNMSRNELGWKQCVSLLVLVLAVSGPALVAGRVEQRRRTSTPLQTLHSNDQVSEDECETCKNVVVDLEGRLNDPQLQDSVVEFVQTNVCPLLPSDAATTCAQEARVVVAQMAASIQQTFVPEDVCRQMGMCQMSLAGYVHHMADQAESMITRMATHVSQGDFNSVTDMIRSITEKKNANEVVCDVCEVAMEKVKDVMHAASIDSDKGNDFFDRLVDACATGDGIVPSSSVEACENLANELRQFFLAIIQDIDQEKACGIMNLCPSETGMSLASTASKGERLHDIVQQLVEQLKRLAALPPFQQSPESCATCEDVVKQAADIVQNPQNQQEVFDFLKQGCTVLQTFEQTCDEFVDEFGPILIVSILSVLVPEELCTEMGYCESVQTF